MTALNIKKANEVAPNAGSLTIINGPPGMGKSTFCGTMAEYLGPENVLVIATLPREVNSTVYQQHNLDTIIVTDDDWDPGAGSLVSGGFDTLMSILRELRQDEQYKGIILDNGTESAELAWHASLELAGVADPSELKNSFKPYVTMREKMETLMRSLSTLTGKTGLVAQPKLVAVPWHIQPAKESMDDNETSDQKGKGSEYEGDYLPMIRGGFRRRLGALVDNVIYADIVRIPGKNPLADAANHYCLQLIGDNEKHVKLAGPQPPEARLVKKKYLDVQNSETAWRDFMDLTTTAGS
jgi:energy-coupling factor transporter ATP-binding protein EcfA2